MDKLESLLAGKRTFRDSNAQAEEQKKEDDLFVSSTPSPAEAHRVCSLDIVCWAYITEMLLNTPDSQETAYFKSNYPGLNNFIKTLPTLLPQKLKFNLLAVSDMLTDKFRSSLDFKWPKSISNDTISKIEDKSTKL